MNENLNASGSATNAGIDYQQRIASWLLVALLFEKDISKDFGGLNNNSPVKNVAFETNDDIDDLKVELHDNSIVYLQVKRSINLSTNANSDFYKTIKQFIKQFVSHKHLKNYFVLATSSDTSSKILKDLFKILESIRLNDSSYQQNPLNKSEKDTYEKYKQLVKDIFTNCTGKIVTDQDFLYFSKKVYIATLDIEAGRTFENSAITYLLDKTLIDSELFWGLLIKNCLTYSSKRISVNKEGLLTDVGKYLKEVNTNEDETSDIDDDIFHQFIIKSCITFNSGRELIIASAIDDKIIYIEPDGENKKTCYHVIELFRFYDDGAKKYEFFDNTCLSLEFSIKFTIIGRAATWMGIHRFLLENIGDLGKGKFAIIEVPANGIEDIENLPYVKAYSLLCQNWLRKNKTPSLCLHCGERVKDKANLIVEIDDKELNSMVGVVHKECVRAIDRIQGVLNSPFSNHEFLKGFDGIAWSEAIIHGQAIFYNLKNHVNESLNNIFWDSSYEFNLKGRYCIRLVLEDGTYNYHQTRERVDKYDQSVALEKSASINSAIEAARNANDHWCYNRMNGSLGRYSVIIQSSKANDEIVEYTKAEVTKYSELIGTLHNSNTNYYTPLLFLINTQTKDFLIMDKYFVFITDPLNLINFIENWKRAGIEIGDYEVSIVENDEWFDKQLKEIFNLGLEVVVDPLFDKQRNIVRGAFIYDQNRLLQGLSSVQNLNNLEMSEDNSDDIVFSYRYKEEILKIRILKTDGQKEVEFGREEYKTLEGSIEALFMVDEIRSAFPAILVDEEMDVMSIFQVAKDIIVPTGTGGMQTARHSPWIDLLRQASIVLLSFPNNDAGWEASQWWLMHLPNAKLWQLPKEFANINEMLVKGFDIRAWILSGLSD